MNNANQFFPMTLQDDGFEIDKLSQASLSVPFNISNPDQEKGHEEVLIKEEGTKEKKKSPKERRTSSASDLRKKRDIKEEDKSRDEDSQVDKLKEKKEKDKERARESRQK